MHKTMNLQPYTVQQLIEAERLAIKYTPWFALILAREYNKRLNIAHVIDGI